MVNGADVRVTPVCKPTHPKPIRDAKREPSKIDAAPSKIRCHSSFSSKLYQILMFLHKRILSNFKISISLVSHPVLWLEGSRRDRNRRGVKFNYVIHRSWRLLLDPFGFDLPPSPKKRNLSTIPIRRIGRSADARRVAYRFPGCHRDHCLFELGRGIIPGPLVSPFPVIHSIVLASTRGFSATGSTTLILARVAARFASKDS